MASYWLLKSEPNDYSYADLEREGRTVWDGVANNLALKYMRQVAPGDEAFFYHTGKEKAIVAIARVETEAYPDPNGDDERRVVFDLTPLRRLARPVTLDQIKKSGEFSDWELVRMSRLSVMPVSREVRSRLLTMSKG